MSTSYNSKLIDRLYQENDALKSTRIVDEMIEIGDAIFIYPIYSTYKKFKSSHYSHYFVSDLTELALKETTKKEAEVIVKELLEEQNIEPVHLYYLIGFCIKNKYNTANFQRQVEINFLAELSEKDIDKYEIESYLSYFLLFEIFGKYESEVVSLFEKEEVDRGLSETALDFLLKFNSKKYLQYYYDNFDLIKDKKSEIILTKEILRWSGDTIELIKTKILADGSEMAQELIKAKIEKDEEKKRVKKEENQNIINIKFSNTDVVTDIFQLRKKINIACEGSDLFKFPLLNISELLMNQIRQAENENEITGCSMELREIIWGINKSVANHGYSQEDAEKIIPGIQEYGSINNLHLYLVSKGFEIDSGLLGLRLLIKVLSKLAHPQESRNDLIKALKDVSLYEFYESEKWQELHKGILILYKNFLIKFDSLLEKK